MTMLKPAELMNSLKFSLLLTLLLCSALVHADQFQSAGDAYNAGNMREAFRLFKELAEQGDAGAQAMLGGMYANGEGVPQDYREAVAWYRKAAEQGHAKAQSGLGVKYFNGEGVPADDVLAYMWLNMAGANGDKDAAENRLKISNQMTSAQIERAQELSRKCFEQNYKNCGK